MLRTLALSAVVAAGLSLMPGPTTTTQAAPSIAPKIATPDSAVEQVRRRGGRGFRGRSFRGSSFRGGRRHYRSRGFRRHRYYGHRHRYRNRGYYRRHHYYGRRHRHRGWRRGVVIGAGLPFLYGAGYYGGYYGSCRYSYRKWRRTGSRYWRHRYYACRGW